MNRRGDFRERRSAAEALRYLLFWICYSFSLAVLYPQTLVIESERAKERELGNSTSDWKCGAEGMIEADMADFATLMR